MASAARIAARRASKGAAVTAPVAITSAVAVTAPTKAEYDALRTDVVNLRATVAALLTSLQGGGQVG